MSVSRSLDATSSPVPRTTRWTFMAVVAVLLATSLFAGPATASVSSQDTAASGSPRLPSLSVPRSAFTGGYWGDSKADKVAKAGTATYHADKDPGSLFTIGKAIGARAVWGKKDSSGRQVTGRGVGVALLDSGVDQVPGLDGNGQVTYGPDLSIETNSALAAEDTFGHGTFLAGIIAGRGTLAPSSALPSAPASVQLGIAPDAKVLALKLAATDGSTDVSQVIAALDWVTQHPVLPDGTRVRVINLSYGTDSTQGYLTDPLAAAAENAWKHGIVVVASAGNGGSGTSTLTDPATDPYILSVGAADGSDRMDGWTAGHASVADFSQSSRVRAPDLVAPGTSVVSLRDPGSEVDQNNPQGLVAGDGSGTLFRGSGTSQAAAVVSGAVADLLQAFPYLTPDQVKYALVNTADQLAGADPNAAGAGMVDVGGAYALAAQITGKGKLPSGAAGGMTQGWASATGAGSLDAARGSYHLVDAAGNVVDGEVDVQGTPWDPARWEQASTTLTSWSGGQWLGVTWTGSDWSTGGGPLGSARWASARWASARWATADWSCARWASARWASARWAAARWADGGW